MAYLLVDGLVLVAVRGRGILAIRGIIIVLRDTVSIDNVNGAGTQVTHGLAEHIGNDAVDFVVPNLVIDHLGLLLDLLSLLRSVSQELLFRPLVACNGLLFGWHDL